MIKVDLRCNEQMPTEKELEKNDRKIKNKASKVNSK